MLLIAVYRMAFSKDVSRLDPSISKRIRQSIEERLTTRPMDFGKPFRHTIQALWSLRVGDWRVIYKIAGQEIYILRIGHRSEIYGIF